MKGNVGPIKEGDKGCIEGKYFEGTTDPSRNPKGPYCAEGKLPAQSSSLKGRIDVMIQEFSAEGGSHYRTINVPVDLEVKGKLDYLEEKVRPRPMLFFSSTSDV